MDAKNNEAKKLVKATPYLILRRAREVPKVGERSPEITGLRTYTLVVSKLINPTSRKKKIIQRLVRKTPCIRLREGVLLFPHLRAKDVAKYYGDSQDTRLLTTKKFVEKLAETGALIHRWSRLRLVGSQSQEAFKEALERTFRNEVDSIASKIKTLRQNTKSSEIETKKLKERYSDLSNRLKDAKARFIVMQKIWQCEIEKPLRRTYNLLLRTRGDIRTRIELEGRKASSTNNIVHSDQESSDEPK